MNRNSKQVLRLVSFPIIFLLVLSMSCSFLSDLADLVTPDTPTPTQDFAQTGTVAAITQQAQYEADLQATNQAAATATEQAIQIEATATAQALVFEATQDALATVHAEATATAGVTATIEARENAIRAYSYYDPFTNNNNGWRAEETDNDFWRGEISISNGVYLWRVDTVKRESMISWADFEPQESLRDFDVAFMVRLAQGPIEDACYGILFRKSPIGFSYGSYILTVCDDGYYKVQYFDSSAGWDDIIGWRETEAINQNDWNLVELEARGTNFNLFINHQLVSSFNDSRLDTGLISIIVHVLEETSCTILYDFFALQPR